MHAATFATSYAQHIQNPPATDGKEYVEPQATDEDRQWALWTHLGPLLAAAVTSGALAPLGIVWGLYVMHVPGKHRPFLADHGRELFNFSLSFLLYWTVGSLAVAVVTFGAALVVYWPFLIVLGLVGAIMGSIAGAKGRYYRYPMCFRFMKDPKPEPAKDQLA